MFVPCAHPDMYALSTIFEHRSTPGAAEGYRDSCNRITASCIVFARAASASGASMTSTVPDGQRTY